MAANGAQQRTGVDGTVTATGNRLLLVTPATILEQPKTHSHASAGQDRSRCPPWSWREGGGWRVGRATLVEGGASEGCSRPSAEPTAAQGRHQSIVIAGAMGVLDH